MASQTVKIVRFIVILCAFLAMGTHGRTLERIHNGRHHAVGRNSAESEMEREMMENHERIPHRHSRGRHTRHRVKLEQLLDDNAKDKNRNFMMFDDGKYVRDSLEAAGRSHAIRKRYNGATDDVAYSTMTVEDEEDFWRSRARRVDDEIFEIEIKQAQNSALCNYTVVNIPDPSADKSRKPKNLINVMCNHRGFECGDSDGHCCMQTYSMLEVSYGDGTSEVIKIFTGCVCARRLYGKSDPYTPKTLIDV